VNTRNSWGCPFCMRQALRISFVGLVLLLVNRTCFSTVPYDKYFADIVTAIVMVSFSLWIIHTVLYSSKVASTAQKNKRRPGRISREDAIKRRNFMLHVCRTALFVAFSTGAAVIGVRTAKADPNTEVCCCDTGGCLYNCSKTTRAQCHEYGGTECPGHC
jgi:hypothetical protein